MQARGELQDKFTYIFDTNLWGSEESQSGLGSSLDATADVRQALRRVCIEYNVNTLLDLPCGDASWIHHAKLSIHQYIGGDVVSKIVESNRNRDVLAEVTYRISYEVIDVTRDQLPVADLMLCRDCLVHLSFTNVRRALHNIVRSGASYLLTTTFPDHDENEDIEDGDWRLINLEKPPFSLPAPIATFKEGCDEEGGAFADKSLALWHAAQLATFAESI
jgi:hypothetical protein